MKNYSSLISNFTFLILPLIILLSACGKDDESDVPPLEGVYTGLLTTSDPDDDEWWGDYDNTRVSVIECGSNCVDITFLTPGVSASTSGTFVKSNSFYSLDLDPVYEDPNDIKSWELDLPRGTGTFDWEKNELVISLQVDDKYAIGGTNSAYFYIGEK